MRLPFVHSTTSGLYITDSGVVWVSTTWLGSRLRHMEQRCESIAGGHLQGALARLVARLPASPPGVISHLDSRHIRYVIVPGPVLDEADSFAAWLEAEAQRHLPPGAMLSNVVVRVQVLEQTEASTCCLLVMARRATVEARVALLESAGLRVLGIRSLEMASGEALRIHPAFAEGRSTVLFLQSQEMTLLHYREGVLQSLDFLSVDVVQKQALSLLEKARAHLTPLPDRLFVVGHGAAAVIAKAREADLFTCAVLEGRLDLAPDVQVSPLTPNPVPVLALSGRFAASEAINFLEPEAVSEQMGMLAKREAMQALLLLGGFVALLYWLQLLAAGYLNRQHTLTQVAFSQVINQLAPIEQARKAIQQLEYDVAQAEHLAGEETQVAGMLVQATEGIPEDVWLEGVDLEAVEDGTHLTLSGKAYREESVATYLERLERAPCAANVRLLYAEAALAVTRYQHAGMQDRVLTRFEIQLTCTTLAPGNEEEER